jgi:uncharacterized protein YbaR (Trm112 family)
MNVPIDLLRCPVSGQPLERAPADLVDRLRGAQREGALRNRDGEIVAQFEGGLRTIDGAWFYPLRAGIPVLLAGEAVPAATAA